MASSSLALVGIRSGSASLVNYKLRAGLDASNATVSYVGSNTDDSLAAPRIIDVKMAIKQPGVAGNDRVEVSLKHTVLDANNIPFTGSVSVKISIPRATEFTAEMTQSLLKQMADYLGGASATVTGQTDTSGFPAAWAEAIVP